MEKKNRENEEKDPEAKWETRKKQTPLPLPAKKKISSKTAE